MENQGQNKMNGNAVQAGMIARSDFGSQQITAQAETASTAVAAKATAMVQARYIMALQRPRDIDQARVAILKECSRPGFAAVARYLKPIGKGIEGPSIRFAEAAIRCMTNIYPETSTVYDDAFKRIIQISVTDLESNVTYSKDVVVDKTVERSSVKEGVTVISQRQNSYGKTVFRVIATDDELLNKEAALGSKALRQLALRLVPGDIIDEAMAKVIETQNKEDAQDPDAARKKLSDAFASIGVQPSELKSYMGQDLATLSPAQLTQLRGLYSAIKDGETSWREALDQKNGGSSEDTKGMSKAEAIKSKIAAKEVVKAPVEPAKKLAIEDKTGPSWNTKLSENQKEQLAKEATDFEAEYGKEPGSDG